jgi:5-(carboxyamino)imidazole ribonucleotide mutase
MAKPTPPVAIIMGSQSDWETMRHCAETLDELEIAYEARIVSAHRTPERLYEFARAAKRQGFKVIIAGAGGGTLAIGKPGAINAALLAAAILALADPKLDRRLEAFRQSRTRAVAERPSLKA